LAIEREKFEVINILYFKALDNNLIHVKFKNRYQHPKHVYELHNYGYN
jgi:hypothetical protein